MVCWMNSYPAFFLLNERLQVFCPAIADMVLTLIEIRREDMACSRVAAGSCCRGLVFFTAGEILSQTGRKEKKQSPWSNIIL